MAIESIRDLIFTEKSVVVVVVVLYRLSLSFYIGCRRRFISVVVVVLYRLSLSFYIGCRCRFISVVVVVVVLYRLSLSLSFYIGCRCRCRCCSNELHICGKVLRMLTLFYANFLRVHIYHLFTETEGSSVFCGPETAVVALGEQQWRSRGHKTHCFPEVSVNKCFVI